VNGGFETGDFAGWAQSGDLFSTDVQTDPLYVHSGSYGVSAGPSSMGYLFQTIPTTPGEVYLISLWLDSPDGATPNEFSVSWRGNNLLDFIDLPAIGWTNIQLYATASTTATTLQVGFLNALSYFGLDDVIVVPVRPVILGITLSGHDLVLNGRNGLSGRAYRVLKSANPTLPLNQWTPIGTNVLSASGNFTLTVPNAVDPLAPQRYFRVQLQ
jgi:hypothetical protein